MPQQTFGASQSPQDAVRAFQEAMDVGFNPAALLGQRKNRLREMSRNLDLEDDSRQGTLDRQRERQLQSPSERRRDEMMGWGRAPTFTSGATASDVRDIYQDPDIGTAANARIGKIQGTLDDAALAQRSEVGDAVDVTSRRNAFADFLKAKGIRGGQYAADVSDEGTQALDAESRRRGEVADITASGRAARLSHGGVPIVALRPGDDPLEGLSEQEKANIKSLLGYTMKVPEGAALRTPEWMDRLGRAKLIDPSFDQTQYKARQDMRTDRKFQDNVQSLLTLQAHADALHDKGKQLGNYDSTPINALRNWWKRLTSDPALASYGLDQATVGEEYARALKGGVPAQAESQHARELLGDTLGQPAQDAIHETISDLAAKRLGAASSRYESVMGKPGSFLDFTKGITTRAEKTAGAPKVGERKTFPNGRTGVWDGTGWDPE